LLLCGIDQVEAGAVIAASLAHPRRPEVELLAPGAVVEAAMIDRLSRLGVSHLWVQHDLTADLDGAVSPALTSSQLAVFTRLRGDFARMAQRTVSQGDMHAYRMAMMDLVCQVVSNRRLAGLAQRLQSHRSVLMAHSVNVAYLSLLIGLELETYIIQQRPRLASEHARDLTNLALGGLLHDIGKTQLSPDAAEMHEAHLEGGTAVHEEEADRADYLRHCEIGYRMLGDTRVAASARQVVLGHHQRYDGRGWPDLTELTGKRRAGPQVGDQIHIFSRIVAVANVLDNLLCEAEQSRIPPVAALRTLASGRFDAWFDPFVCQMALRCLPPFPVGAQVTLSDGREAVVVRPSLAQPCRPVVRRLDVPLDVPGDDTAAGASAAATTAAHGAAGQLDLQQHPELHIASCAGQDVGAHLFELPVELPRLPHRASHEAA
jgi:HD-GYP domain-containing protein (c-di-GMP phosphodiesterase class II)